MSQNWRRRLRTLAIAGVVYALLMFPLGCGRWLADRVLLIPSTEPVPAGGASAGSVQTDDGEVEIFVARSMSAIGGKPERYVLRLMGNASRAEYEAMPTASRWGDRPTEVWAMNYPGFGASQGSAALSSLVPAAEAVWEQMNRQSGDVPCYIDADSMGTAVALSLASRRRADLPPAGIILKNPPPLRSLILSRYGWWNLWLLAGPVAAGVPKELDSIVNASGSHAPAIFLQATADGLIPPDHQQRIIDAYAGRSEVVMLHGADHNTLLTFEEESEVRRLIDELFDAGDQPRPSR